MLSGPEWRPGGVVRQMGQIRAMLWGRLWVCAGAGPCEVRSTASPGRQGIYKLFIRRYRLYIYIKRGAERGIARTIAEALEGLAEWILRLFQR